VLWLSEIFTKFRIWLSMKKREVWEIEPLTWSQLSAFGVHLNLQKVIMVAEPQSTVVAVRAGVARPWQVGVLQSSYVALGRVGQWAGDTAQQFGALVSALMAPAVLSAYLFAAWSLASNLGWTDSFLFGSGPFSNWLVWLGAAATLHLASSILRRHGRLEE
jgi:hypothetical protein